MNFVKALNSVSSQVWAFMAMIMGAGFIVHGSPEIGRELLMGAFALFRTSSDTQGDSR